MGDMYQAELRGKLSEEDINSEDILTSNVFSFLKYCRRDIFLMRFLKELGLKCTMKDIDNAIFQFWPVYDNDTEPDVIIIIGNYYLLFEAKYKSGFMKETVTKEKQIIREIKGGLKEAKQLHFKYYTITRVSGTPNFIEEAPDYLDYCKPIHWKLIYKLLIESLISDNLSPSERAMVQDLKLLLERKESLRGFISFERLKTYNEFNRTNDRLFYNRNYFYNSKNEYFNASNLKKYWRNRNGM
jgi:hypothetical protein